MARALSNSIPSNSLAMAIRTHFGLTQAELGRYLGVNAQQIGNIEAGRRSATPLATLRLARLARLLPPPEGFGSAAPKAAYSPPAVPAALFGPEQALPGPLAAAALLKRQRQCARRIVLLRRDLHVLGGRSEAQERRRWALAVLPTALTFSATDLAPPAEQEHLARWLAELAAALPPAPALRPDPATALALLLVRLAAAEAEAATLAQLLTKAA
ncbi:helix-turn-helix transcriptional regulator [Hymenobacter chitinivorans]|uniref:DNA-binding XRE family transcriptional regulator n=1 Tax=Hymenobacter chitinivorans DSM 11115 TaxID=1121954 RepID=A0A2M9BSK7_9BACT|nr:helix-turn-helix transcriptional regulator [Hymenobacter chitinivorans]PJJ60934.1 DNA-binding XRE family transcriptional regulator [Hymenobacter chitinivorans DSM 11115]